MNALTKAKLAIIFASCQFWMPTFVLFLTTKGVTTTQTYELLAFYSLCIVLFEYPTGVIGDYFSHKVSMSLGYLLLSVVFAVMVFPVSFAMYAALLVFGALGAALVSGSDTALIHALSQNFKDDYAQVRLYSIIMSVCAIAFGGFAASFDLRYPFYLSALFFLIASAFTFSIGQYQYEKLSGNIFATARTGMQTVWRNQKLRVLIGIASMWGAFFFSFKWFYNPLFLQLHIPVAQWGIVISIATLLIAFGAHIYRKVRRWSLVITTLIFLCLIVMLGYTQHISTAIAALFAMHILRGYIETMLDVDITETIDASVRASVLSLKSLVLRLFSAGMIFASGFILDRYSFAILMYIFAGFLFIATAYPLLRLRVLSRHL